MGFRVILAGQDITSYVQEQSIRVTNNLGQGAGVAGGQSGRASTCSMLTSLGPAATAVGAGSTVSSPKLVRQGEIKVYDNTNTCIFGGYVGHMTDQTDKLKNYTQLDCYDYFQSLARINVSEIFSGQTDVQIISFLMNKYASWIDITLLPATGNYTFSTAYYLHQNLQQVLQDITDKAGQVIWITPDKKMHYLSHESAATAAFGISDSPDYRTTFPAAITDFETDDTAIINRAYFYGGKYLTADQTQDLSTQANGSNDTFTLPYYPHESSDGKFHLKISGVDQVLGFAGADTTKSTNVLKKDGGSADALLNRSGKAIQWSTAPATASPGTITFTYKYELPLTIVITDTLSYQFFGEYFDGIITDNTVFESAVAIQRCRVLLAEQSMGLVSLKFDIWRSGLFPGTVINVSHNVRGINDTFMIQSVEAEALGNGYFVYHVTCGAWHWNVVDIILAAAQATVPVDDNVDSTASPIEVPTLPTQTVGVSATLTTTETQMGMYYPRTTPVGDGHDAYPGFSSI